MVYASVKNYKALISIVAVTLSIIVSTHAQTPAIRIAHYIMGEMNVPEDYLEHVQKCGYNYILAHADLHATSASTDWKRNARGKLIGEYDWGTGGTKKLYNTLIREFEKADKYNLRLIPCFNIGSRWAGHWGVTNDYINYNTITDGTNTTWKVPIFAPDPNGIDKSWKSYLEVVNEAFEEAELSYGRLDFIHIGHDEVVSYDGELLIGSSSSTDRNYIRANGDNALAYYKILADEVKRRVDAVTNEFGYNTKCIMWADAYDRSHNGGISYKAWSSNGGRKSINVKTMNATIQNSLKSLNSRLIMMPWNYRTMFNGGPYDAEDAISYLRNNGFDVIPGLAYEEWNADGMAEGRKMLNEWVRVGSLPVNSSTIIGYCVHNWWDGGIYWENSPRPLLFEIVKDFSKRARFYPLAGDVIQMWDNNGRLGIEAYTSDGIGLQRSWSNSNIGGSGAMAFLEGDIDNDSRSDVFQLWNNNGRLGIEVYKSDGTGLSRTWATSNIGGAGHIKFFAGEFNGDNQTDIFQLWDNNGRLGIEVYGSEGDGFSRSWATSSIGGTGHIEFLDGDIDGDGKTDIFHLWNNNGRLAIEVYSSRNDQLSRTWGNSNIGGVGAISFLPIDYNNDGKTDIAQLWNNNGRLGIEIYESDGTGLNLEWATQDFGDAGAISFLPIDYNNDGKTDIAHLSNNNGRLALEIYKSNGRGLTKAWSDDNIGGAGAITFRTTDINQDGRTDILQLWNNNNRLGIEVYTSNGAGYYLTWSNANIGGANNIDFLVGDIDAK